MNKDLVIYPKVKNEATANWTPASFSVHGWVHRYTTVFDDGMGSVFVIARSLEEARNISSGIDAIVYNSDVFNHEPDFVLKLGNISNKGVRHAVIVCPMAKVNRFTMQEGFLLTNR